MLDIEYYLILAFISPIDTSNHIYNFEKLISYSGEGITISPPKLYLIANQYRQNQ